MSEDKCICCGDSVPEGRHICIQCEYKIIKLYSSLSDDIPVAKRKVRAFKLLKRQKKKEK